MVKNTLKKIVGMGVIAVMLCALFSCDSKRRANVIISSVSPSELSVEYTVFPSSCSQLDSATYLTQTFTFQELSGDTTAHITTYSISYVQSDGTSLSQFNVSSRSVNVFIDAKSSSNVTLDVTSQALVDYIGNNSFPVVTATLVFTGKDGVGHGITISASYTIKGSLKKTESSCPTT